VLLLTFAVEQRFFTKLRHPDVRDDASYALRRTLPVRREVSDRQADAYVRQSAKRTLILMAVRDPILVSGSASPRRGARIRGRRSIQGCSIKAHRALLVVGGFCWV